MTDWSIVFYQILGLFFVYWYNFFQSSGNVPSSGIVLKSNFSGEAIDLLYYSNRCIVPTVDVILALRFLLFFYY